jgi:hypothetical protein
MIKAREAFVGSTDSRDEIWDVNSIRGRIAQSAERGTLSEEVVSQIIKKGYGAPLEFELLDYKETIAGPNGLERIVKSIVAMHNTFGGYLIYGIGDTRNGMGFPIIGIDPAVVNIEQIKDIIASATETRVLITACNVAAANNRGEEVQLIIVHVPRRLTGSPAVAFQRDAKTEHAKSSPEFRTGDFFYRDGDTTQRAIGTKIFWLAGERLNPYLPGSEKRSIFTEKSVRVQHNLPDRSSICPKFIRREGILNRLWTWVGDDLSHWRGFSRSRRGR